MTLERIIKRIKGKEIPHKSDVVHKSSDSSAEKLKKAVDKYLIESNITEKRHITGFHPSYEGIDQSRCKRWWYLLFNGGESKKNISATLRRIFDNGHAMHERWGEYFSGMGILLDRELPVSISSPVPVVGTADGIIKWNGRKLIELKSIGPEGFAFRKLYNKPKDAHYLQAQLYLYALSLEEGYIIYEDKGRQDVLIFHIKRDDEVINKYFKKKKKVYKYIEEGRLPERPYKKESKICQTCDLLDYCWSKQPP